MQDLQNGYFVTGTDTDVGKTIAASWAMLHLDADYWKPVQCGIEPTTDMATVRHLTQFSADRFHPETYRLLQPLSPHEAAKRSAIEIEMDRFTLPKTNRPLVVEGAGGLMVPMTKDKFVVDLAAQLALPIILVCRSGLGTINHTLLSLEALRARGLHVTGLIISGTKTSHNREALEEYGGGVPVIAEIDFIKNISREALLDIKPEIDLLQKQEAA